MTKFTKKNISYKILLDFLLVVFWSFIILVEIISSRENEIDNLISIVMIISTCALIAFLLLIVYNILYIYFSGYEITTRDIKCKRGVIFKKDSILEIKRIHSVKKSQNILQKLFKISVLLIDSGSTNTASQAEIIIIESSQVVDKLIGQIKDIQNNEIHIDTDDLQSEEKEVKYFFSLKQKIKFSLLNSLNFALILLFFLLVGTLSIHLLCCMNFVDGTIDFTQILLMMIVSYFMILIMFLLVNIIYSCIRYYDFKVYFLNNNVEIKYGLFVTNYNTFSVKRIKAVIVRQNLVQRIMGYSSINLEVIGYSQDTNDENSSQLGILVPLCKSEEVSGLINSILPMYVPSIKEKHSIAFFPFISWHLLFLGIFLGGIISLLIYEKTLLSFSDNFFIILLMVIMIIYLVYLTLLLISSLLQYNTCGLSFSNDRLTIICGGFLKKVYVIQYSNLIGIQTKQTYFQKRKGICTYYIHFRSNALSNVVLVKNLDIDCKEKLESLLTL